MMQRLDARWGLEVRRHYRRRNTPDQPDEGMRRLVHDLVRSVAMVQQGYLPLSRRQLKQISAALMPMSAQLGEQGRAKFQVYAPAAGCCAACTINLPCLVKTSPA